MARDATQSAEQAELSNAIQAVLNSPSDRKLVIAGPGTGKTTLFRRLLQSTPGERDRRLVLTFINTLVHDLDAELGQLARVRTLHSYCLSLLHRHATLRHPLSSGFRMCPGLASLIGQDWDLLRQGEAPHFVAQMRTLAHPNQIGFYLARGKYYDAVDYDDTVYRAHKGLSSGRAVLPHYDLVLIDEYQDFNALEASVIDALAQRSPILIAGDDDQALYGQLRDASWDHIRLLNKAGEYTVFNLPFCMRCPRVVVDAVNEVLAKAKKLHRLKGRIDKPYKYFPPKKGADSAKYPRITEVQTSVQRQGTNYMGQYLAQAISRIPRDEISEAAHGGYPAALVIAAKPYRDQVTSHLEEEGYVIDTRRATDTRLNRESGVSLLATDSLSNLGWRIILHADKPSFLKATIAATADGTSRLVDVLPDKYRDRVLTQVGAYEPPEELEDDTETFAPTAVPAIRVTSFERAKGLSAQHVYIAGLHDGELPRDSASIKDLEICKFVVALSRTRKKCTLIHTRMFAGKWMTPSSFISWIGPARMEFVKIDAQYWRKQSEGATES